MEKENNISDEMNAKFILINAFTKKKIERSSYWRTEQAKCGYPLPVFIRLLEECIDEYKQFLQIKQDEKDNLAAILGLDTLGKYYSFPERQNYNGKEVALQISNDLLNELLIDLAELKTDIQPQQIEVKFENKPVEIRPVFTEEVKSFVFDVLKDFFSTEQQGELKRIIDTGAKANEMLIFKGNGNRLTDTFSKLIRNNFIVGCEKKQLSEWIISSFVFVNQGITTPFSPDYVEKYISRKGYNCKRPLIDINDGKPERHEPTPNKRRRK